MEMSFLIEQAKERVVVAVTHAGFIRTALTDFCSLSHGEAFTRAASCGCIVSIQSAKGVEDEHCNQAR
jgi:broad specificity phosphatase PhoE